MNMSTLCNMSLSTQTNPTNTQSDLDGTAVDNMKVFNLGLKQFNSKPLISIGILSEMVQPPMSL